MKSFEVGLDPKKRSWDDQTQPEWEREKQATREEEDGSALLAALWAELGGEG